MSIDINFIHDNNIIIKAPSKHSFTNSFQRRPYHEIKFRLIISYFLNNKFIDPAKNIIDLGAWIGDNSLPWAKLINGIVYAIDPSKDNCSYIQELINLNNINNIKIIQKAISNRKSILTTNDNINHCSFLYINLGDKVISKQISLSETDDSKNIPNQLEKHIVNATSLDILFHEKEIDNIDFIHLDVEGMEYYVILGAEDIITKYRPIVAYEQHLDMDKYIDEITAIFKNKLYDVYIINEIMPGCRPDCRNFLAIPQERINDIFKLCPYKDILIKL